MEEILSPKIIYEDSYLLVVDKPSGMVVNNAETTKNFYTLQEWTKKYLKISVTESEDEKERIFFERSGVAHRLDKETSGILLIGKNPQALASLMLQFKEKKILKTYIALVHGKLTPASGEIQVPIGRLPWNRTHFGVLPEGRQSQTLYKVVKYCILEEGKKSEILSLVEAYPKTGRTHQIRVHMRYLGHPIFADSLYAGRKNIRRDRKILPRHFLHAKRVQLLHPVSGKQISFTSEIPAELAIFLEGLNEYRDDES